MEGLNFPTENAEIEGGSSPEPPDNPVGFERCKRVWERVAGTLKDWRVRAVLLFLGALAVYWFLFRLPRPPEENVVATYRGGKVTTEELRRYLHEFLPRCFGHPRCRRLC